MKSEWNRMASPTDGAPPSTRVTKAGSPHRARQARSVRHPYQRRSSLHGPHHVKVSRCLNCGRALDAASSMTTKQKPRPGDVTICIDCGHIMAFADDLSMRALTDTEMIAVAGDRDIVMTQRALAELRKDRKR